MIDKKELKKKYKQTLPQMGIYMIRNLTNGKILIGRGLNLSGKENSFRFQLQTGTHTNSELQSDYNKTGDDNFVFEIIDILEPKADSNLNYGEELKVLEEMWIEKLQPFDGKGYNKRKQKE
ncbi:MAG: GIY-YIG nuclease family protein [Ignavibacteria bacterium]|jgi:hypothetical protein